MKNSGSHKTEKRGRDFMINRAVLNFMKCSDGSIVASNNIAKFLAAHFGCALIDSKESCSQEEYDELFVVNGPLAFCSFREEAQAVCALAKKIIWVGNDYMIKMPPFIKKSDPYVFAAYEDKSDNPKHSIVNWNQLTYFDDFKSGPPEYFGLAYYGAYRSGREKYFKKYLNSDEYQVFVSASARAKPQFASLGKNIKFWNGSNLIPALSRFSHTIYIEDEKSHSLYCSPANRFYECLSSGVAILFDESTIGTFERAGIDVKPWVVRSQNDVKNAIKSGLNIAKEQSVLRKNYRKNLTVELQEALKRI